MLVRHVMSADVFGLRPETPIGEALRALRKRRIQRAPLIAEDGALLGIVTERELLRAMPSSVAELETEGGRWASLRPVLSVAAREVQCAHPDDHIDDLARLFLLKKIAGVPVVDGSKVVGMITESDIFRVLLRAAHRSDTMRITVQCSRVQRVTPVLDVVRTLGLELAGLAEYERPLGGKLLVLRVRGKRALELGPALTRSGWVLLDCRRPSNITPPDQSSPSRPGAQLPGRRKGAA